MTNRKYILHSICLIFFSIILLSRIVSAIAETETNTTLLLEDNLVILLDYSASSIGFRDYIQSHAIHSIQNLDTDSNVSVVVYGGFIKSTELYSMNNQENRSILQDFVYNITKKFGDVAYNNGDQGFEEARKILYNSTGTKQILLISSGVISDGRNNSKDRIVKKIKEIKNNNTKIILYQVSTTYLNNPSKYLYKSFKYLSDETNTKAVVLNPEVDIVFLRNETRQALSTNETSETITVESPYNQVIDDEYLNEFSNYGEKSTLISKIQYDRKDLFSSFSEIHFYSYCNQTCIIVPFDIRERKFYDDTETLEDIFRSKNAIELVKSGNLTESAYTFSSSNFVCDYFDFNVFKEESKNLGGKVAPIIKPESAKMIKQLKAVGVFSKFNPESFIVSLYCLPSNNDDILDKITGGEIYIDYLKRNYTYAGLVRDFQNYNLEIMEKIKDRKDSYWNLLYLFNNPVYDQQLPLIQNNYAQLSLLSNQNYENDAKLADSRINDKTKESKIFMENATHELSELNNQIPYQIPYFLKSSEIMEKILNFVQEPETNYSMARLKRDRAESFLNNAEEKHYGYKFNSAIQNSNDFIAQSKEGIKLVNIEKSKVRYFKNWNKILE